MIDPGPDPVVYVDANVFIRAVEGTEEVSSPAKTFLAYLRANKNVALTSELTLAEVLAPPSRPDALPLHIKRRVYLDLLSWSSLVSPVPVTRDILIETADLRAVAGMKLPDAIRLVSAIRGRCCYFVSSDTDFSKLPQGMKLIRPDAVGIDGLLKELA